MTRVQVASKLSEHYTAKLGGKVWCSFDLRHKGYCIRGESLPAHPDMQHLYPNGWSMLDYIKPNKARELVK